MAPHSGILAWEILWTEEPGGGRLLVQYTPVQPWYSPWGGRESDTTATDTVHLLYTPCTVHGVAESQTRQRLTHTHRAKVDLTLALLVPGTFQKVKQAVGVQL